MKNVTDVPSPCVEICELDQTGQWCLGCGRSLEEIAGWTSASDEERSAILDILPERLVRLNGDSKDRKAR